MTDQPKLERTVSSYLLRMVAGYESVFRDFYGLDLDYPPDPDFEDSNHNRFEASLAPTLRESAYTLMAPRRLIEFRDKLSASFPAAHLNTLFGRSALVVQSLEIELARQDIGTVEKRRQRIADLAALATEQQPNARAAAYLNRAARCYILDLLPETVVMCRSALEAAFEDRVGDSLVREHSGSEITGPVTLWHRIEVARKLQLLEVKLCVKATEIRRAGNDSVHNVPVDTVRALDAIRGTLDVINGLVAGSA